MCYVFYKSISDIYKEICHLLGEENAIFKNNNLTIAFNDTTLQVPANCRVILHSEDFEHILSVPTDHMIKLTFELIPYKTDISIIYIHPAVVLFQGKFMFQENQFAILNYVFGVWKYLNIITAFRNLYNTSWLYKLLLQYSISQLALLSCINLFLNLS